MVMSGSTWRKHPFIIGKQYIAKLSHPDFTQGDILARQGYELLHIGHSHYDGASVFTFMCLTSQSKVSWWWFDRAPESRCLDNFELVADECSLDIKVDGS